MFESATLLKTISCLKRRRSHEESTRICSCSRALALVLPGVRPNRWAIDWRSPGCEQRNNGEPVLSLTADDFILTDNGVPQLVRLALDTDSQPLALAVVVQTGRQGAIHLSDTKISERC